jgi:hypothetical protein
MSNKNSLYSVIDEYTKSLEKWVLEPGEALSNKPSGFVNMTSSTLGKLNSYSIHEMLMSKNEINPSTAIRMKSLVRHLKSDAINDIYGTPSMITFILSYPEDLLIKRAVAVSYDKSKLTINKNLFLSVPNKPQFTIDNDIDIFVNKYNSNNETKYSIYAMYNTQGDNIENGELFKISNPFVTSRNDVIIEGQKYFTMFITARQYERTTHNFELSGANKDINIVYSNHLIGFTVLYKGPSDKSMRIISTYLEGSSHSGGMAYSTLQISGIKTITLKFDKVPDGFSPINGTLRVAVFTTNGKDGNFNIPYIDSDESLEGLVVGMRQDTSDMYQEALIPLIPTVSLKDTSAEGGRNALSIEEVRALVIERSMNAIITPMALSMVANKDGFSRSTMRQDLLAWEQKLSKSLKDPNGRTIPSRTIDISYLLSELNQNQETNTSIIAPYDIFSYDEEKHEYKYVSIWNMDSYTEYLSKYKKGNVNDYAFPYFLRINTDTQISVLPYDLSINSVRNTEFSYISNNVLDKMSIVYAEFLRNPLDTTMLVMNGNENIAGNFYSIRFDVFTSDAIIDHLSTLSPNEDPYVKFKIIIRNKTDNTKYILSVKPEYYVYDYRSNSIQCIGYLETNNAILGNEKICITNNSLSRLTYSPQAEYSFYFIDSVVDAEIIVIFKDNDPSSNNRSEYDEYLTSQEIEKQYYIGIIYKINDITLAKNMKTHISLSPDIKYTQPIYKTAKDDIPLVYDSIVYEMENGEYVSREENVELPDGSYKKINSLGVLHNKGDQVKENDGKIGTFNIFNGNWSVDNSSGIYSSNILGGYPIYASVRTSNGFVIFGGKNGRVGCYDVNNNTMYPYDEPSEYASGDASRCIIKTDGSPTYNRDIRCMKVISLPNDNTEILIAAGEGGYVASCNLSTGKWRHFDRSFGDEKAIYCNNGSAMADANIYCMEYYENQLEKENDLILFAGESGRICSCNIKTGVFYSYNSTKNNPGVTHDGSAMGYKSILSMKNYMNNILFLSGVQGYVATYDLVNKVFSPFDGQSGICNDGGAIGNVSIYASSIINGVFIISGEKGRVASYNIAKSEWTKYNQKGISDEGGMTGNKNINAVETYDNYVIFASDEGNVSSYNIFDNKWTSYDNDAGTGIGKKGSGFIKSSASSIVRYDNIIFFTGKAGNIVFKYRKGDIILDANNRPIIEKPSEIQGIIRDVPAYDRIYAVKSNYFNILKSYNDMIDTISAISYKYPEGCNLFLGIKNTSGISSTFKFIDTKTKDEIFLDNLALSLSIGVKFNENVIDDNKMFLVKEIENQIHIYIDNVQSSNMDEVVRINFNAMLDSMKSNIPNISYFELYSINNYDANRCQTIFWRRGVQSKNTYSPDEYLSIKSDVDESKSDISNQAVVFKPAVDIAII